MKAKDLVVGARYVYAGLQNTTFVFVEGPAELVRRRWVFREYAGQHGSCNVGIVHFSQGELKRLVREAAK